MKRIIAKIKYPKFLLLILTFIIAYIVFTVNKFEFLRELISSSGYIGAFISGLLFSYGFTAGLSTGSFIILSKTQNILLTGFIGGLGALIGDYFIFKIIRTSFKDEIHKLLNEKIIIFLSRKLPKKIKHTTLIITSSIIIASPLPDEIGVFLLASTTKISDRLFSVLSYILNTTGILVILLIGQTI